MEKSVDVSSPGSNHEVTGVVVAQRARAVFGMPQHAYLCPRGSVAPETHHHDSSTSASYSVGLAAVFMFPAAHLMLRECDGGSGRRSPLAGIPAVGA